MRLFLRALVSTQVPIWMAAFGVGCSLLSALWIRSVFLADSMQFVRRSAVYEAHFGQGAIVLDNSPQIASEHKTTEALKSQLSTYIDHFPRAVENGADPTLDARLREKARLAPRFWQLNRRAFLPGSPAFSRRYPLGPPTAGIDLLCIAAISAYGYRSIRRVSLGRCLWCGYDRRASGEHCSEFGRSRNLRTAPAGAHPIVAAAQ